MNAKLLRELAERCEQGGSSWRLDDFIAQAAFGLPPCGSAGPFIMYTTSLDAAVTLVPEYYAWMIECHTKTSVKADVFSGGDLSDGVASTPALALCAAALKARAAIAEQTKASKQPERDKPALGETGR